MSVTRGHKPRRWRGKALIALFAATAALVGGGALIATPAFAMIDDGGGDGSGGSECFEIHGVMVCEEEETGENGGGGGSGGGGGGGGSGGGEHGGGWECFEIFGTETCEEPAESPSIEPPPPPPPTSNPACYAFEFRLNAALQEWLELGEEDPRYGEAHALFNQRTKEFLACENKSGQMEV